MPRSLLIKLIVIVGLMLGYLSLQTGEYITLHFFRTFDVYAGMVLVASWAGVAWFQPEGRLPSYQPSTVGTLLVAVILAGLLWAGTYAIMLNYPLSRDEHMVLFDGATYAEGRIFTRLPEEWSGYAEAFAPAFLQQTPEMSLLVSDYLPGNAFIRSWLGKVIDPALTGPLYVGIAFLALAWNARKLLGDTPQAIWVVLGVFVLSAQIAAMGMTTYAMSAHLAFNMVWMALFLKDRPWSHALAIVVGIAAMGLHQFAFHPLFAGPLILLLVWDRRFALFAAYAVFYAAGLLFWMSWSGIVLDAAGIEAGTNGSGGVVDFIIDRVAPLLANAPFQPATLMSANLLRALTWNALFAFPLVAGAWVLTRGREEQPNPMVIALFASLIITLLFMYVVLPLQGHGWGYRYIHGHLGSVALLAGYGYRQLAAENRARTDGAVITLGLITVAIMIPAALWSAHRFIEPHVKVTAVIAERDTDFVVIDDRKFTNIVDETRNLPDLSNRPLIFSYRYLTPAQLSDLCQRGTVSVIGGDAVAAAGVPGRPMGRVPPLLDPCQADGPSGQP